MEKLRFYGPLLTTAWMVGKDWVTSYGLVSTTVFAVLSMAVSVIVVEFAFKRPRETARRIARLAIEIVIGPAAIVGSMFLISLLLYPHERFRKGCSCL